MAGRLELRSPAAPPHTRGQRAARVQDPTRARHRAAEACPEITTADDDYTKVLSLTGAAPATVSGYKICPRADPFTLHASQKLIRPKLGSNALYQLLRTSFVLVPHSYKS